GRHDERSRGRDRSGRGPRAARARPAELLARAGVPRPHVGRAAVIAQTRAELLKIRSTRTTLGLFLAMVALVLLIVILRTLLDHPESLSEAGSQRDIFGLGSIAALFAALAGVLVVTNEFRFGTIRPTFLFTPRRSRVILAKIAASLLTGVGFAVVAEGLGYGI